MAGAIGIIEGFTWEREHALNGHWGELRPEERVYLLSAMHTFGYNTFLYDPRCLRRRNADPQECLRDPGDWPASFDAAREHDVAFLWGIAPGPDGPVPGLFDGVERLLDLGVNGIALLFDDLPDAADVDQVKAQGHLARNLEAKFPGVVRAFRSGCRHEAIAGSDTIPQLLDEELPEGVALFWSGADPRARSIAHVELPDVNRRPIWIWDPALSVASPEPGEISLHAPEGRSHEVLAGVGGWMLDIGWPLDRALPGVADAGLIASGVATDAVDREKATANAWARWLHDVPPEALTVLRQVAAGTITPDAVSEEVRVALLQKPGLQPLVERLLPPPASATS